MSPRNLLTEWARVLLASLAHAGARDVVISPGSRSTPFAHAALRCAELRCHSVVDERSAAFFAVGMAKVTGQPALLVCTSGSAGAHYLPAVIEAAQSHVPLLVLTADRPPELFDCAAPQTIDQNRLLGAYARWYADLGAPRDSARSLEALRRKAVQAVVAARHPRPGPVHLNAPAAKPLEPIEIGELDDPTPDELALSRRAATLIAGPGPTAHLPHGEPSEEALSVLLDRLRKSQRGLVVAGRRELWQPEQDTRALLELAARSGLPLLVEASSQLRLCPPTTEAVVLDAVDGVLNAAWGATDGELPWPDFVLELGPPLASSAWAAFAERLPPGVRHGVSAFPWPDPQNGLTELVLADAGQVAARLVRRLTSPETEKSATALELSALVDARAAWSRRLRDYNELAWQRIDADLRALRDSEPDAMPEPIAVQAVVTALPPGALLALGNSLAIREVDWVCRRGAADVSVWVQRGANGIDGLIAGASGAAEASGRPTCLLLGDVSALHDLGSLAVARRSTVSLVIAVLDNAGGRIFGLLPFAERAEAEPSIWRYWSTPPELDWRAAAETFGLRYVLCQTAEDVQRGVQDGLARANEPAVTLLHLAVQGGSAERFLRALPQPDLKRLRS